MDIVDNYKRSEMMSGIRSKNTKPEIMLRKYLFSKGFRFRVHVKNLAGRPDIVLRKYKTVIFVHGCFWHRHENCKFAYVPKSNVQFWDKKFIENIERDKKAIENLQYNGWKVLVVWECEIKRAGPEFYQKIESWIKNDL